MLWGGLQPIVSRVALDALACTLLLVAALSPAKAVQHRFQAIGLALFLTIVSAGGVTTRWTIVLPTVVFAVLQGLRSLGMWIDRAATVLSIALILFGALLSILFPPVSLPGFSGLLQ